MMSDSPLKKGDQIDLRGRRLLVVGLAREGTALARFLTQRGAQVVVTDLKPPKAFGEALQPLAEAGVELVLGEHPPALLDRCEVTFVSPGVPFDSPFLNQARARSIPLSTESRLFCQLCPAPIAAVTGSSGKTTTTTLVSEMLKADARPQPGGSQVWVGGNMGQPLIERLDQIQPGDDVVLELSSFQLEYFHPSANDHVKDCDPLWLPLMAGWSPPVGAILNVTPNHLDRHPSMEAYIHAKRSLIAYRRPGDIAILGLDNEITRRIGQTSAGRVRWFSTAPDGCSSLPIGDGACLSGEGSQAGVVLRNRLQGDADRRVCRVKDIRLRGAHNLSNVLAACAIADALDASIRAMREAITSFTGVEHRLELVDEIRGVAYYNDSIATSPERLAAALESFDEPIVLLAGGRDKHLPWDEVTGLMLQKTRHVILFGEAVELIARAIEEQRTKLQAAHAQAGNQTMPMLHRCVALEDAVAVAVQVARRGDVVLLSPGCTSFDAFRDFAERGERFRELVKRLTPNTSITLPWPARASQDGQA